MSFLRSPLFWLPFAGMLLLSGGFVLWELGYLAFLPSPVRVAPAPAERGFAIALVLLLSLNTGLAAWRTRHGTCPVGTKRAVGIGGGAGVIALLCPVCLILPFSILGLGTFLALLAPFIPLLQIVAIILLLAALSLLWPR
jgi:hypothetical protein